MNAAIGIVQVLVATIVLLVPSHAVVSNWKELSIASNLILYASTAAPLSLVVRGHVVTTFTPLFAVVAYNN